MTDLRAVPPMSAEQRAASARTELDSVRARVRGAVARIQDDVEQALAQIESMSDEELQETWSTLALAANEVNMRFGAVVAEKIKRVVQGIEHRAIAITFSRAEYDNGPYLEIRRVRVHSGAHGQEAIELPESDRVYDLLDDVDELPGLLADFTEAFGIESEYLDFQPQTPSHAA